MGRRRPVDFVGWGLYRRAWALPVLAALVVLATSFRPEAPAPSSLPPTLTNDHAANVLQQAKEFEATFPERVPGSSDSIDSAQWMRARFQELAHLGVRAETVPTTTTDPHTGASVNLVNVEAVLPGRTRELVVIHAHRDEGADGARGGDAAGQLALLAIAEELAATRDRRRTYMFVSTDGATLNGGGARALAERLARRRAVVAVIGIDRLGAGGQLRVDAAPSGEHAPPLGLVTAARHAVGEQGGRAQPPGSLRQLAQLAAPVTLREHGQLLTVGLPALTVTAGDDQIADPDEGIDPVALGAGMRAVQGMASSIDQLDKVQNAGRTWVASERRVYRGWALKLLIASLLVPAWMAAVDLLVRYRGQWDVRTSLGTAVRLMLAGAWSVVALWMVAGVGLLPAASDRPPNPGSLDDVRWLGLLAWVLLSAAGWLLARGPDWRRTNLPPGERMAASVLGDTIFALVLLVVVAALTLAVNPYTVLFAVPTVHAWMWLASRHVFVTRLRMLVWCAGAVGPLAAVLMVGARGDVGLGTAWFAIQLVQTRTVPGELGLLVGAGCGLSALLALAITNRVARPALPRLLRAWLTVRDGHAGLFDVLPAPARRLVARTAVLRTRIEAATRVPSPRSATRRRAGRGEVATPRTARGRVRSTDTAGDQLDAGSSRVARERERARRRAATAATRTRVKSR